MEAVDVRQLNRSSPSCVNRSAQRTDFFHGLLDLPTEVYGLRLVADPARKPHEKGSPTSPDVGRRLEDRPGG